MHNHISRSAVLHAPWYTRVTTYSHRPRVQLRRSQRDIAIFLRPQKATTYTIATPTVLKIVLLSVATDYITESVVIVDQRCCVNS